MSGLKKTLEKTRKKKVKIVIVDDHLAVRKGFLHVLQDYEHLKVIGEASNGRELFEILPELSPDIILLDIEMPQMNGYEALQKISKLYPEIKTIILSGHYGNLYVNEFLKHGARAYIPKACDIVELMNAIEKVYEDGYYMSPEVRERIASFHLKQLKIEDLEQMALSDKEVNVLKLLCDGLSSKQMAHKLKVDINTINFHKKNIFRKTSIKSVGPLVKYAIRNGYTALS